MICPARSGYLNAHGAVADFAAVRPGVRADGVLVPARGCGRSSAGYLWRCPVASVMRVQVKPSPCTAAVCPSMGARRRAARSGCGEFGVFSWRYAPLLVSMLLPQRIPSGTRACMAMRTANKAAPKAAGEKVYLAVVAGGVDILQSGKVFFLGVMPPSRAAPQRCPSGQKRRW